MSGMNDNIGALGSWSPTNPSPRTLISNFLNEDFGSRSFSGFLGENSNERSDEQKMLGYSKGEESGAAGANCSSDYQLEPDTFAFDQKPSTSGGLALRIAANGFSVPKLNVWPGLAPSDVLTIPDGLSPTSLLDSPIFLSNSMAQPSPTTGKLMCGENNNTNSLEDDLVENVPEAFAFKPPQDSNFSFFANAERRVVPNCGQQPAILSIKASAQPGRPIQTGNIESGTMNFHNQLDINLQADSKDAADDVTVNLRRSDSFAGSDHSPPPDDQQDGDPDAKGELSSMALGTPAEDGYNWRKYGQKQVKGSKYPRSYYKCTHLNCQVKKKVERSHEGHITEIIYKGAHNHPKPPPNRRSGVLPSHPFSEQQLDGLEQPGSQASIDNKSLWASAQNGSGQNWGDDILEAASTAVAPADACDPSISVHQNQDASRLSADAIDVSSTMSNDDEDDQATHGSASLGCDGEVDETESKRRKLEACAIEMSAASRAVREPRVVVQTTSEVDILDDGYRWRKYGQKVVKGNPNPRSYYKCTSPGCTVRKHVERASHDLKSVITTYEGKHNHEVPAARSSGHQSSAPSSNTTATSAVQPHSLIRRPEPGQDGLVRFDGRVPLGAFGLPGRESLGPGAGFSFMGQGQPGFANFPMSGLGPVGPPMKMPVLPPVYPFAGHHQPMEGGFIVPKGEPKEEAAGERRLQLPNGQVYQQMIGRLPLGPQM